MKDYYHFSANDFAMDESFRAWVWRPTNESNVFWREWISKHPDKAVEVEEAIALLQKLNFPVYSLSESEVAGLWNNIKVNTPQPTGTDRKLTAGLSPSPWRLSAVAAAALIAIGLAVFFMFFQKEVLHYETAYGETKRILLPDSSSVVLNANSSIVFSNDWQQQQAREVLLEGEAFFEVVHTVGNQPFRVKVSDGVAVEVLGTSFNVYHRKADTKVVLNTGQIALSFPGNDKEEKILMEPGELVEYKNKQYSKRRVDTEVYAAWTDNKVILDETSLKEMIEMANNNFGVTIRVQADKMLQQTVSGSMPVGDAESFVLQVAKVFQLKAEKRNDYYLLKE
ncbi:MAG: FecR domain-containing protein [Imperialibacter sp.]|uniref:FecR family protein n=1 Tax=Imperialibacter sp. TaxID=2038411 RepID=UPI0032ED9A94